MGGGRGGGGGGSHLTVVKSTCKTCPGEMDHIGFDFDDTVS